MLTKNFKLLTLCTIILANSGLRASEIGSTANLTKLTYGMGLAGLAAVYNSESNTEKVVRGTYCAIATAFLANLLSNKNMCDSEKSVRIMIGCLYFIGMIGVSEDILDFIDRRLGNDLYSYERHLKINVRQLIKDYKQLETARDHEDCSDLIINLSNTITAINRKHLEHDCTFLNNLIKRSAEKNYAQKRSYLFNEIVYVHNILNDIKNDSYNYLIDNCQNILAIEKKYTNEEGLTNFLTSENISKYLKTLEDDIITIKHIQRNLDNTPNVGLQTKVADLLASLNALKKTIENDLISKWWGINAIQKF